MIPNTALSAPSFCSLHLHRSTPLRARATQNRALSGASPSLEAFGCSIAPRPDGRRVLSRGAGARALPFTDRAEGVASLRRSWALMTGAGHGAGLHEATQGPERAPTWSRWQAKGHVPKNLSPMSQAPSVMGLLK